jgi:hypothetical protein
LCRCFFYVVILSEAKDPCILPLPLALALALALALHCTGIALDFGFGLENKVEPPVLFSAGEKVSVLSPRLPHT